MEMLGIDIKQWIPKTFGVRTLFALENDGHQRPLICARLSEMFLQALGMEPRTSLTCYTTKLHPQPQCAFGPSILMN